jgi:hypothetical protein
MTDGHDDRCQTHYEVCTHYLLSLGAEFTHEKSVGGGGVVLTLRCRQACRFSISLIHQDTYDIQFLNLLEVN